jgi:hypothetical protein
MGVQSIDRLGQLIDGGEADPRELMRGFLGALRGAAPVPQSAVMNNHGHAARLKSLTSFAVRFSDSKRKT